MTKLRLPLQDKRLSLERYGDNDTLADKTYVAPGGQQSLNVVSGTGEVDIGHRRLCQFNTHALTPHKIYIFSEAKNMTRKI